jgi:hypothetical protein
MTNRDAASEPLDQPQRDSAGVRQLGRLLWWSTAGRRTALAIAMLVPLASAAATPLSGWLLSKPDQIQWQDGPPSLLPGAKVAILEGDSAQPGFFTMRLKVPDGYRVLPHRRPNTERLTILQGIVHLGTGDHFDARATQPLAAGTYSAMPPGMAHFAWMEGETILQLSSIGPWQVVYVNPADDPRHAAPSGR